MPRLETKDYDNPLGRTPDEIEQALRDRGYRTLYSLGKPLPVETAEEESELEDYNYIPGVSEVGQSTRKLAGGVISALGSSVQGLGVPVAMFKGWMGEETGGRFSGDPDDNLIYNLGSAVKWGGDKVSGPVPNQFKGGWRGFLFHDTPAALGTAVAFMGETVTGGKVATTTLKAAPKLLGKKFNFARTLEG